MIDAERTPYTAAEELIKAAHDAIIQMVALYDDEDSADEDAIAHYSAIAGQIRTLKEEVR
jgi:hypothetical protein